MNLIAFIFWLSVLLIFYSYAVYPAGLYIFQRFTKTPDFIKSDDLPAISILISAYNEEAVIKGRIENIFNMDYPQDKIELIIATDGSDDKTNEIIESYQDRGVVLYAYKERRGKVNVLNETLPKAKNDIIVFSDANTMFIRSTLKNLVRRFGDQRVGCVCGKVEFINADGSKTADLEGIYWRYETFLKRMEGARGSLLGANGAIYAIRKDLYVPPEPDTIIDDFMIPMRILEKGYAVIYAPEAAATEEAAKKIIQEKQRRIRIGAGDFQALFRLKGMLNPLKGFSAFAFMSHKVLRWKCPFFMVGAFVSNVFFLDQPFYVFIFILQCAFYASAFIGQALSWSDIHKQPFSICYYFVSMNLALFLGFIRFLTGSQKPAWERTQR